MENISLARQWYYAAIVAGCVAMGQAVVPVSFYSVFVAILGIIISTAVFRGAQNDAELEFLLGIMFVLACVMMGVVWAIQLALTIFFSFLLYFLYVVTTTKW